MSGLLKWTGEQFISMVSETESSPEIQSLYALSTKLEQSKQAERAGGKLLIKNLENQQSLQIEKLTETLKKEREELDRAARETGLIREEAELVKDQVKRAEQLRSELSTTLQQPSASLPSTDDSLDFCKSELVMSRQVQANLKAVISSEQMVLEEAVRDKETVLEAVKSREAELEKATIERLRLIDTQETELQELRKTIKSLKNSSKPDSDEKNLKEQLQIKQRTVENLRNEKTAVMLQIESQSIRTAPGAPKPQVSSKLSDFSFLRSHPVIYKATTFIDERLLDIHLAMEDQALVKLAIVCYLLVLHLWVVLSTLGIGTGC